MLQYSFKKTEAIRFNLERRQLPHVQAGSFGTMRRCHATRSCYRPYSTILTEVTYINCTRLDLRLPQTEVLFGDCFFLMLLEVFICFLLHSLFGTSLVSSYQASDRASDSPSRRVCFSHQLVISSRKTDTSQPSNKKKIKIPPFNRSLAAHVVQGYPCAF